MTTQPAPPRQPGQPHPPDPPDQPHPPGQPDPPGQPNPPDQPGPLHPPGQPGQPHPPDQPHPPGQPRFDALLAQVMASADRFGHREHLHLTWLAVRRYGAAAATPLISAGIQRTARYAGRPQKYHATVSRAWVELVAHHLPDGPDSFDAFLARFPPLLDKRLLGRHYSPSRLSSAEARSGWVEPDLAPLPGR
jgi:hypothetical protein